MRDIKLIILAAGKGKRMNSEVPKVLVPLMGQPLIQHLLISVNKAGVSHPATIVVGKGAELVRNELGGQYWYAEQSEQLGTGHAVRCAENLLRGKSAHVMILYGDHPLVNAETIEKIADAHLSASNPLTMATVKIEDFNGWKSAFFDYGRVIRNGQNEIDRIIEMKDATDEEKLITELNPSYFCFNAEWLWENLKKIDNNNAQKEYYLTALPRIAKANGERITDVSIDPIAALGANTAEQLLHLEELLSSSKAADDSYAVIKKI